MIVMNYSSLSRYLMRPVLLALVLPLCLSACLEKTPAEKESVTTAEVIKPQQQTLKETTQTKSDVEELSNSSLKAVSVEDITTAKTQLNTLIADTSCDTSMQCKVIAVGSRACGGPSSFEVYSTKTAKDEQVKTLSKTITELESNFNAQKGMMSICQHLTTPSTQCVENKCVKLEGSAVSVF